MSFFLLFPEILKDSDKESANLLWKEYFPILRVLL